MAIEIFADGANLSEMLEHYNTNDAISGFTTNPSLMRKAGVTDYEAFAKEILSHITEAPISFEVFSDDIEEMEKQARKIADWGKNVYIKIPITNTKGESTAAIVKSLSAEGVQLNITAIFTIEQVTETVNNLSASTPSIISVFAGRIADTGVDPMPIMQEAVTVASSLPHCEVLWASTREALNIKQAEQCRCHIITVPFNILKTMKNFSKDLSEYSLETVKNFHEDAKAAGYQL